MGRSSGLLLDTQNVCETGTHAVKLHKTGIHLAGDSPSGCEEASHWVVVDCEVAATCQETERLSLVSGQQKFVALRLVTYTKL